MTSRRRTRSSRKISKIEEESAHISRRRLHRTPTKSPPSIRALKSTTSEKEVNLHLFRII